MSDNDSTLILYIDVSLTLCKNSHSQCDAGSKAAVTFTGDESSQKQHNHILHVLHTTVYKNDYIYTH